MGTIVDRTHTKWGKCRPYLIFFPAIIGVMTILCFVNGIYTNPGASKALIVAWAAASYIIWGMLFTVCDIPLWGITSLMTEDQDDNTTSRDKVCRNAGTVCVETSNPPPKIGSINKPCDQGLEQYTFMLLKDYKFHRFPA